MKRILVPFLALLILFVIPPAMAIGPGNAKNNPHVMITPDGTVVLHTPGGVQNEYNDPESGVLDHLHMLNASKFENHRGARVFTFPELAYLLTHPEAALEFENKWGYISQDVLISVLKAMGYTQPGQAEAIAAWCPEGVYFMYTNVGK